ncbi:MAG: hypothetical protein ABSB91_00385 [Sedimentisphaerales bacterium]|jgi:hypothetical protein
MTQEILNHHLDSPACQTIAGLWIHLRNISLGEINRLCFLLKADSMSQLAETLWTIIQDRKSANKRPVNEKMRLQLSRMRETKQAKKGHDKFLARSEAGGE